MHQELVTFASRFAITPADAYVLPALFERVAQMAKLPMRELLSQATYSNPELGYYLAKTARKVAREDRAS